MDKTRWENGKESTENRKQKKNDSAWSSVKGQRLNYDRTKKRSGVFRGEISSPFPVYVPILPKFYTHNAVSMERF